MLGVQLAQSISTRICVSLFYSNYTHERDLRSYQPHKPPPLPPTPREPPHPAHS